MPKALICRNPFRPQLDREDVSVRAGTRLDTFLRGHDLVSGRGKSLVRKVTFIVQVNDQYLLCHQWSRRILSDDILTVVMLPGGGGGGSNPLQMVMMVAIAVASAYTAGAVGAAYGAAYGAAAGAAIGIAGSLIVNALLPPPKAIAVAAREQASPTYTIGAQGNRARLMEAIPCLYGRYRVYPDMAADPYTETDNNDQYVYQLFCISQGRVAIEEIRIEDNPISSYAEVTYQVAGPGEKITLFPDNVVTATAVQGLEMKGPNEDGFEILGPFATNPAGTLTDKIAVDIGFPQGLFEVRSGNKLRDVVVRWAIEARAIDDAGQPVGGWFTLGAEAFSAATQTPQIRTYRYSVTPGRYQVQAKRQSNKFTDTTYANLLQWVGMRAYLPSTESFGDVTMLAVAIRATNNINQQTQRRINVIATRMLQKWDPVNGWSASEEPTRSPAWALADVVRNSGYGRGLPDSRQNLFELYRLDQVWRSRGDYFDGVFDTTVTLWEALTRIARVGRAVPMFYVGVIDYVRTEPKTIRRAMFSPFNMVTQSFSIERKYSDFDAPDHIIMEYTDSETWLPDEVVCALPGSAQLRPFRVPIPGVTVRAHAWREGMSMAAANRDQRKFISFTTSLEGNIPKYGDLVQVSHDIPAWGLSGFITSYDSVSGLLRTSEPLDWYQGENHYAAFRRRDGSADGPHLVVRGPDEYSMRLAGIASPYVSDGFTEESTHYQFGPGSRRGLDAIVISADPDESGKVTLTLVNSADSVHIAEYGGAVPPPPPASLLPLGQNAPVVDGLSVYASPDAGYQIASATPARGAQRYEFQSSNDLGATWLDLGSSDTPSLRIRLAEGPWRVRVRGVGVMAGPWRTWSGLITATMAPPPALRAFSATSLVFGIRLDWTLPDAPWLASTELFYSDRDDLGTAINLGSFAAPAQTHTLMGLRAGQTFYFWARIRDVAGNPGPWFPVGNGVKGEASANADLILDYLKGQITATQLGQALLKRIETGEASVVEVEAINTALAAMYTIKTQLTEHGRTVLAGIGVGVENNDGVLESQVLVFADRFAVMHPNGADVLLPFVIQNGQVIINDAIIAQLDAAKIKFGQMHGDRIETNSFNAKVASIGYAYIASANIHDAQITTLKVAGNSVTIGQTHSHGGMWVDKSQFNWQVFGFYNTWVPQPCDVLAFMNGWQDLDSLRSAYSKSYEFMVKHEQSGRQFPGIESAVIPGTYGENSGQAACISVPGCPAGDNTFTVFVRATFNKRVSNGPNLSMNPDNPAWAEGAFSTTARFNLFILARMR